MRCKIFKKKEFPAKSSSIRSYGPFRRLTAGSGAKRTYRTMFVERLLGSVCDKRGKLYARTGHPDRQRLIRGLPGVHLFSERRELRVCFHQRKSYHFNLHTSAYSSRRCVSDMSINGSNIKEFKWMFSGVIRATRSNTRSAALAGNNDLYFVSNTCV